MVLRTRLRAVSITRETIPKQINYLNILDLLSQPHLKYGILKSFKQLTQQKCNGSGKTRYWFANIKYLILGIFLNYDQIHQDKFKMPNTCIFRYLGFETCLNQGFRLMIVFYDGSLKIIVCFFPLFILQRLINSSKIITTTLPHCSVSTMFMCLLSAFSLQSYLSEKYELSLLDVPLLLFQPLW